jgi:hypothetical protein
MELYENEVTICMANVLRITALSFDNQSMEVLYHAFSVDSLLRFLSDH